MNYQSFHTSNVKTTRTLLYLLSFRDETNIIHMVGQSRFQRPSARGHPRLLFIKGRLPSQGPQSIHRNQGLSSMHNGSVSFLTNPSECSALILFPSSLRVVPTRANPFRLW